MSHDVLDDEQLYDWAMMNYFLHKIEISKATDIGSVGVANTAAAFAEQLVLARRASYDRLFPEDQDDSDNLNVKLRDPQP